MVPPIFLAILAAFLLLRPPWIFGQGMVDEEIYFAAEEKLLLQFDINDPGNKLSLLDDLEGTSMILKVKNPAGRTIGVFKPTSGNTSHVSEIVAYRLCRRLKLPVCAPTIHKTLSLETIDRFTELMEQHEFKSEKGSRHKGHYLAKERFRKALLEKLDATQSLPGAFKSWISPLILYEGLGRISSARKHPVHEFLSYDGPIVSDEAFELSQCTQIYKPHGCYRAEIKLRALAEQFTGVLVVDALIGNNDRFSGGNMHLFSLEGRYVQESEGRYLLPSPSLLMLDNGSGFMRNPQGGLNVLTRKLKITRFARRQFDGLFQLWNDFRHDRKRVMAELGLIDSYEHAGKTFKPADVFEKNLERLTLYLHKISSEYGEASWF